MTEQDTREAFEAWARDKGAREFDRGSAWIGWCAALQAREAPQPARKPDFWIAEEPKQHGMHPAYRSEQARLKYGGEGVWIGVYREASREAPPEPLTALVAEAIEGYKAGLANGPMEFVSAAFDVGWTHGAQERAALTRQGKP